MLQALKEWIEGLFRPMIRVENGISYLARTPTIYDIRPIQATSLPIANPGAAAYYTVDFVIDRPSVIYNLCISSPGTATGAQAANAIIYPSSNTSVNSDIFNFNNRTYNSGVSLYALELVTTPMYISTKAVIRANVLMLAASSATVTIRYSEV